MLGSSKKNAPLPRDPGDLVGLTEGGKGWIGLLFSLGVLAILVWAILTAMHVRIPVL